MPITVTAPEGVLTAAGRTQILPQLTKALADASGAPDNPFLTSIIGGTVHILPAGDVYAGGQNRPLVLVELKLPAIGLPDPASRAAFIKAATDIVDTLTVPTHDRANTWINILNAADGAWGIGGRPYPNNDLIAALSA